MKELHTSLEVSMMVSGAGAGVDRRKIQLEGVHESKNARPFLSKMNGPFVLKGDAVHSPLATSSVLSNESH